MKKLILPIACLTIILAASFAYWSTLDDFTKCNIIYGKNICNYYAMVGTVITKDNGNFTVAMNYCETMENVPKKDGCFDYLAGTMVTIDINKAKEACDKIKDYGSVGEREDCYKYIENPK